MHGLLRRSCLILRNDLSEFLGFRLGANYDDTQVTCQSRQFFFRSTVDVNNSFNLLIIIMLLQEKKKRKESCKKYTKIVQYVTPPKNLIGYFES